MHDIRLIRDNPEAFDAGLARRGLAPHAASLLAKDEQLRAAIKNSEELQAKSNAAAKAIGAAMGRGDKEAAEQLKAEVASIKADLPALEAQVRDLGAEVRAALSALPNIPAADVPDGTDEMGNVYQTGFQL